MIGRAVGSAVLLMIIAACSGSRALPEEAVLFPNRQTSQWWMINIVPFTSGDDDTHFSLLFSGSPEGMGYSMALFASLWTKNGDAFYSGMRVAPVNLYPGRARFPVVLEVPGRDSLETEWYCTLGRKRIRVQCAVRDTAGTTTLLQKVLLLSHRGPYLPAATRKAVPVSAPDNPSISSNDRNEFNGITRSLPPMPAEMRSPFDPHGIVPVWVNMHVLPFSDELLENARERYIGWLDLRLDDGSRMSILYENDGKGRVELLESGYWDAEGQIAESAEMPVLSAGSGSVSTSLVSGNAYPLSLDIALPDRDIVLTLRPRKAQQEVGYRRNALWMGAVEAVDPLVGACLGLGNMIIIKR